MNTNEFSRSKTPTNQIILEFKHGTKLQDMKKWVDYFVRGAATMNTAMTVTDVKGYDNGICIVSGTSFDKIIANHILNKLVEVAPSKDRSGDSSTGTSSGPRPSGPGPHILPLADKISTQNFIASKTAEAEMLHG